MATTIESNGSTNISREEINFDASRDKITEDVYNIVYAGRCRGRNVALIEPKQHLSPDELKEFKEEVEVLSNSSHPNVVQLMGACTTNPIMLVSERCYGDLQALLASPTYKGSLYDKLQLARDTASGLKWLHFLCGITYGEIKISDLLLSVDGKVKIGYFGFRDKSVSRHRAVTITEMKAAEQACVFNFGDILWEFIKNHQPFSNPNYSSVAMRHEFESATAATDQIPSSLQTLLTNCWNPDPSQRCSFQHIIEGLNSIMVDSMVDNSLAAAFWKNNFLTVETVEWTVFKDAVNKYIGKEVDMDQTKALFVEIIHDDGKISERVSTKQFDKLSKWFGDFFVPETNIIHEMSVLCKHGWFHGDINSDIANNRLLNKPAGTFLIHLSSIDPLNTPFILSLCANVHYMIRRVTNGYEVDNAIYPSLEAFVQQKANVLRYPCPRPNWSMSTIAVNSPNVSSASVNSLLDEWLGKLSPNDWSNLVVITRELLHNFRMLHDDPVSVLSAMVDKINVKSDIVVPASTLAPKPVPTSTLASKLVSESFRPPVRRASITFGALEILPNEIDFDKTKDLIGSGTSGSVYRGRCRQQDVAVKFPNNQFLSPQQLEAFQKEVLLISINNHPNVVRLMGACIVPGYLQIVMERCYGDVKSLLENPNYKANLFERLKLARDTACGMNWLHDLSGTIHGDLKPSNLLIDAKNQVKIADFGLSHLKNEVVKDKILSASLYWMAPEKIMSMNLEVPAADVTEKVDVFSFGIILWQIVTRLEPYAGVNFPSVQNFCEAICLHNLRPPVTPEMSESSDLYPLMSDCWNSNPAVRCSFQDIIRRLNLIMIGLATDNNSLVAQFWRDYFLERDILEYVEWDEFRAAMQIHIGTGLDLEPLKQLLVEDTQARARICVTIQQFDKVAKWFGNFFLPALGPAIITEINTLWNNEWFHGDISVEKANNRLSGKANGTFLIRLSSSDPLNAPFSLSLPNNLHVRIYRAQQGGFQVENVHYPTIESYVQSKREILKFACPREVKSWYIPGV